MKKLDTRKVFKPEEPQYSNRWLAFPGRWSGNSAHFVIIDLLYSDIITGRPPRTFVGPMFVFNIVSRTVRKLRGDV